ncbi:PDDEXK nuclease domain-containing protein [uncultured Polaribacter sp.]|uniref:PDDEXK nuclease domain-containing protein n=1 Tax=uncultured Polaribacter sp. TaxID=174711 RepID=UPI00262E13DD|nr:PDDEXK nuclease domain-containing protein [uncultured Polaribacter sp.]
MNNHLPQPSVDKLYTAISSLIIEARNTVYKTANTQMVKAYCNIGKMIVEEEQNGNDRAEYGKAVIDELSKRLTNTHGKGFTKSNLSYMRQFYNAFPIFHALRDELSWTHYKLLLKVPNEAARIFYLEEAIQQNWSTRTLERQINSLYHQRLLATKKENQDLVKDEAKKQVEKLQASDFIKDPYVLEFTGIQSKAHFYEKELEQAIIDELHDFLLELGKGFAFVARQKRISFDNEHFYIDLVFYNYILKCFLLIDLKTGKLTHQDIGQMDSYIRVFEDKIKQPIDNPTIGLILCSEKNQSLAKYSLLNDSEQIFASKYVTYLPTEEELQNQIDSKRKQIELEKKLKN